MTEAGQQQRAPTPAAFQRRQAGVQRQRDSFASLFGTEREAIKHAIDQAGRRLQNGRPRR